MPDNSKSGGKKSKKGENGKGTSSGASGFTSPPISDTVSCQTGQMLGSGPGMTGPIMDTNNMSINYMTNPDTCQIPMSGAMCNVNNVNNTPCVIPQGGYQPSPGQYVNMDQQFGHVPIPQTQLAQQMGQNCVTGQTSTGANGAFNQSQTTGYSTSPTPGAQFPVPAPPPYTNVIYTMLKGLEHSLGQKLVDIETHLHNQTQRWESVETQLQDQNGRMNNIEQQLAQMNALKHSVSNNNTKVTSLGEKVNELQSKVNEYDQNFQSYSDLYDDLVTSNTDNDTVIKDLLGRVESLEENQSKSEDRMIDIQWRSMRETLIFTGIQEPQYAEGEYEDVETTLRTFIKKDMKIERYLEFDRVHRLGRYDQHRTYPRPIIAKFERYKDKEYVRQAAPNVLVNTGYGVREQFPQEIDEKRKLLYPIAKKARQNPENKVRLVRDRLYVNGYEVKANEPSRAEQNSKTAKNPLIRRDEGRMGNSDIIRSRTVYSKRRPGPNWKQQTKSDNLRERPTHSETPQRNRFNALLGLGDSIPDTDPRTERKSTKNKASSPIDRDMTFKKQKEGQSGSNTDTGSSSESEMATEDSAPGSQQDPQGVQPHSSSTHDRNPEAINSDDVSNNRADSKKNNSADSGSVLNLEKDQYTQNGLEKAVNLSKNSNAQTANKPLFSFPMTPSTSATAPNEPYSCHPVVTQPVASPPLNGTNF